MTHENKHTPAPWVIFTNDGGGVSSLNLQKLGDICYFPKPEEITYRAKAEFEANAHLIAAAPEMLHEMEKLAKALEDTGHEPEQSFYDVIKKARGL